MHFKTTSLEIVLKCPKQVNEIISNDYNYDNSANTIKIDNGIYFLDVPHIIQYIYKYIQIFKIK